MDLSQFKIRSFIIGIIALGLVIVVISFGVNQIYKAFVNKTADKPVVIASSTPNPSKDPKATVTPGTSTSPRPGQSPVPTSTASAGNIAMNPATGSNELEIKNPGISIDNIAAGDKVSSPQTVNGRANVTNTKVIIEIHDKNGNALASTTANGCIGLDACPFSVTLTFNTSGSAGWLYAYNPSDNGQRLYEIRIPINFRGLKALGIVL